MLRTTKGSKRNQGEKKEGLNMLKMLIMAELKLMTMKMPKCTNSKVFMYLPVFFPPWFDVLVFISYYVSLPNLTGGCRNI